LKAAAGARKKRGETEPEDHALGRSRGGWGSKFHRVTDGHAIPLAAVVSARRAHESTRFVEVMEKVRPPRWIGWPLKAAGDKGDSYPGGRRWLEKRCIDAVIPQRSDQNRHEGRLRLDKRTYRKRSRVENRVGWLDENRRISTRYDRLAVNFQAFLDLAIIRRYLRILAPHDPSDTP
jgi:hypothetical protein